MTKVLIAMLVVLLSHKFSAQGSELSELDKAMIRYEQQFQRPFPISSCSTESKKLELIEKAINADVAYLTKDEDAKLKKWLSLEYQKKYAKSITDFELTIARVHFRQDQPQDNNIVQIPFRYEGIDSSNITVRAHCGKPQRNRTFSHSDMMGRRSPRRTIYFRQLSIVISFAFVKYKWK
jgi:hypothetical protein